MSDVLQTLSPELQRKIRLACIFSWPVCLLVFAFFFIVVAGFVPPPSPAWSGPRIAHFYASNRTGIRIGLLGAMFASALLLPTYAVVSQELKKLEGPLALLGPIQWGGAIILTAIFQIICLLWLEASFRPGIQPNLIRAMNDYGWFCWSTFIPTYSIQYLCVAAAAFLDPRPDATWPRWLGWLNLWVAVSGAGGGLAVFFKHGPLAWNGLIGFWIPVAVFAVGTSLNLWYLRAAVYRAEPQRGDRPQSAVAGHVHALSGRP